MAKIKLGILGGFSGKVGTVIGGSWNSINYMRALAKSYKDPETEGQMCQRGRFATTVNFLKRITPCLRIGYRERPAGQSTYSAAMSYVLTYAIDGCGNDAQVNFTRALVSRGNLTTVMDATASVAGSTVTYSWTDNSGNGNAQTTDVAMLLAYNKDKEEAVYDTAAGTRADGEATLTLPAAWDGDALAVYLSFYSEKGKSVSNSLCLHDDETVGGGTGSGDDDEDDGDHQLG